MGCLAGCDCTKEIYEVTGSLIENFDEPYTLRQSGAIVPLDFYSNLQKVIDECEDVLVRRHADYGPKNIAQSPGGALNGIRVRMWDKVARINNLIDEAKDPQGESLRDSFIDIANYGMIALMVLNGDWPGADKPEVSA